MELVDWLVEKNL